MQDSIFTQKAEMRKSLRARARAVSPTLRIQPDAQITAHVLALPAWQSAKTIFLFVSMVTEPATHALIQTALDQGKQVAVPLCLSDGIMEARQITDFRQLSPKQYGILAPDDSCPLVAPAQFDLILAPCVATDVQCRRLGNGGGYYDRFFPQVHCPIYCLCRADMVEQSLPVEPHDYVLDAVITENGIRFAQK